MRHLSRRAVVIGATSILALGILVVGAGMTSATPTARSSVSESYSSPAHGPDHAPDRDHGPDHAPNRDHGPDHAPAA